MTVNVNSKIFQSILSKVTRLIITFQYISIYFNIFSIIIFNIFQYKFHLNKTFDIKLLFNKCFISSSFKIIKEMKIIFIYVLF